MTKPVLSVTQPDGSRKYVHPLTGEAVNSVTTIIKAGIPQPWMGPWAAKMAALHVIDNWKRLGNSSNYQIIQELKEAHINYAEEKADIGDVVHDLVDHWCTGRPYTPPREVKGYVDQFIKFLTEKRPRFIENEVTVWSDRYGYAGTADFIMEIDGKKLLADLKTGKSLHPEIGLQLSALAHADFIVRVDGTQVPIPRVDGLAGLHLRPRSWKLVEVKESESCFETFLAARDIMRWTVEVAPYVL